MNVLKKIIIAVLFILIIWIDLPENISFLNYKLHPLRFSFDIFGLKIKKEFKTHLGLDLKGGSHLVFEADTTKVAPANLQDALNGTRDIIEKRVNYFGVSEPAIYTLKSGEKYRIGVDLPGITDISQAINLIGKTAQLTFKEEATVEAKIATATPIFKDTGLMGKHVKKASLSFDPSTGKPEVMLTFNKEGEKLFAEITKRNVGKPLAIIIDNFIISAPLVKQPITEGNAVITGNFTVDEAKKLVIAINSGALPLPIKLVEQKNIGPTFGEQEIKKSVYAGTVGLLMVLLFMVFYYGKLGIIASLGLIIYGLISLAIFRLIPVVLTLPGVAGFILSIGMAVDANILIFERIKEEQRAGKELDIAIKLGFGRAIDAIKDANITTLLVAFILFNPLNWEFLPQFGMVRGFALTLAIGVATSLFTGVVITKRLINLFYKQ